MLHTSIERRTLTFKRPATTSRGTYDTRTIRLIRITDDNAPGVEGVGECSPLPDLSCDAMSDSDMDMLLVCACDDLCQTGRIDRDALRPYPSVLFGLESAMWQLRRGGSPILSDTPFGRGESGIPINGLVWMGAFDEMMHRMQEKVRAGFKCVKIKIGGIDFEQEVQILSALRSCFGKSEIELRLDANGAFTPADAPNRLDTLAKYDIHSIEQPIRQGQWDEMAKLCASSPIDIALDEELIGVNTPELKDELLDKIRPRYVVVKPTLHGGLSGAKEWIDKARERGIGSWVTSALESNAGLNAIAHFAAEVYGPDFAMPQGLGTGQLFTENIDMPIRIDGQRLFVCTKE